MDSLASLVALAVLAGLCAAGAYLDVRYRRLPNLLCVVTAAAGIAASFALETPAWPWSGPLHAVLALLVGMALFAGGMIGGGDAKFYAALAAWFPLSSAVTLIGLVAVSGLVLLVVWLVSRKAAKAGGGQEAGSAFAKLPYGVAIGAGALALAVMRFPAFA